MGDAILRSRLFVIVDHPAGTEVFVDERFAFPPPASRFIDRAAAPVSRAWDDGGRDVIDCCALA